MIEPQPLGQILGRAWELLIRNRIIIVPALIVGVVVGIVNIGIHHALATPPPPSSGTMPGLDRAWARPSNLTGTVLVLAFLVGFMVREFLLPLVTQVCTTAMAGAAWQRGVASFADAAQSFRDDAGRIIATAIGLVLLGIVAVALAITTFGISLLAFYVLTLYAMPAAILAKRPGFSSISDSFRIAAHRFVPTFAIAIVLLAVRLVFELVGMFFLYAPLVGPIFTACIAQVVIAYATLVIVGEYRNLTAVRPLASV